MNDPKQVLRALFAAGDAGDIESFGEYLASDVVVHAPAGLSTVGIEDEKGSWRRAKAAVPDLHHEFLELIGEGSVVAARCIASGTLRGTLGTFSAEGRHFSVDQSVFAHFRDGRIHELWEIVDTAPLAGQLGSPPGEATPTNRP